MIAFACIARHAYCVICNFHTSFSQHGLALWFEQSRFDPLVSEPSDLFDFFLPNAQTHSGILALVRMHELRCASFCTL